MIPRHLAPLRKTAAAQYPIVSVTGPRQSGKTTLVRATFPIYDYVSLEAPDHRAFALDDPRGFLRQFDGPVILDEVQKTPEMFSYLQGVVDEEQQRGRFILTGSHNFLLLGKISQSLAGRCAIHRLLPLAVTEISGRAPMDPAEIGVTFSRRPPTPGAPWEIIHRGGYPRLHEGGLDPHDWLRNYHQTYLERDVREVTNVGDLEAFARFVRLCAGRCGQLLNLVGLANDCGISHTTAKRWLSLLESSFVVFLLRPHFQNFSKRLVKMPKLYFIDTGLLCYLLRIRDARELRIHGMRGAVFENWVIGELFKNYHNRGREPDFYFWRDSRGNEIDLVLDLGQRLLPIEIKSGETVAEDFFKGLEHWRRLTGKAEAPGALVYGGERSYHQRGFAVYAWDQWG